MAFPICRVNVALVIPPGGQNPSVQRTQLRSLQAQLRLTLLDFGALAFNFRYQLRMGPVVGCLEANKRRRIRGVRFDSAFKSLELRGARWAVTRCARRSGRLSEVLFSGKYPLERSSLQPSENVEADMPILAAISACVNSRGFGSVGATAGMPSIGASLRLPHSSNFRPSIDPAGLLRQRVVLSGGFE